MVEPRKHYIGWAQAFFSVMVLWGISNVFMSYSTQVLEVHKIIFACTTFTSCSFCLLFYAGSGKLSKETLRSIDTWAYGIIMLINYFITLNLFSVVTATEASLLQRFSVIFSLFSSWVFLMRKPNKWQLIGVFAIAIGLLVICDAIPEEKAMTVYILMFLAGVFQSLRLFVAEFHRPHQKAVETNDIKSRCRVIGYIMFVITLIFVGITAGVAFLQSSVVPENRILFLIQPENFFHMPSIIAGMVMGIFIYTPIRYLEFASTHIIKTENYLTITSFSFFSTLFWEWATMPLTGLSLKELSNTDIIAGVIITAGALIMALSKLREIKKEDNSFGSYIYLETQNLTAVDDSREITANTLEHFGGDVVKAAGALDVPPSVITAFLDDKEKVLAFKNLPDIARIYRHKVAGCDALTGLINRAGFMITLRNAPAEFKIFSILYLDLDKFKPVNDTHGHDAGDEVLKAVANRLEEACPTDAIITRMGGDEYCIILPNSDKKMADSKANYLQQVIAKPFKIRGIAEKIEIGASIGIATYPKDGKNVEKLLTIADGSMYGVKHLKDN